MKKLLSAVLVMLLFITAAFTLSACGEDVSVENPAKPGNIQYDGTYITWSKAALAEHYTVQINDGEAKRSNTTSFAYNAEGEAFDVTVSSVLGSVSVSETKHFSPLGTVSDVTVNESGLLSWTPVENATAYKIKLNGNVLIKPVTEAHYQAEAGASRIRVRAIVAGDDSYYSSWSDEKSVTVYSAPGNLKYDGEKISWSGVASTYEVKINGVPQTVNATTLSYNAQNEDFTVDVKAIGNHEMTFDSETTSESFYFLEAVTDATVENGILKWTPIESAEGYELKINSVVQPTRLTEASYDKLSAGSSMSVEIRPFNQSGNYFSVWSMPKSIYILPTPSVTWNADIELDGEENNNFTWNIVNGASGYSVEFVKDGMTEVSDFSADRTFFPHSYSAVGVYTVRVKALASIEGDYYDSRYSDPITIERLAAPQPVANNHITSDPQNLAAGFTVNYEPVANASGYQLYKDGVALEGKFTTLLAISDNDVADDSVSTAQEYTYMVRSMGGVKTVSGKKYVTLPCLTSAALSFNIKVLPMPTSLTMSGFTASWSDVSDNSGYALKHDASTITVTATSGDLSVLTTGVHDVSVCARGNGNTTLASHYTPALKVHRLTAPTNIRISYGEGEGQLSWNSVANANSYQAFLNEDSNALSENAYSNMYQYITEQGTSLHMIAVANTYNDLGTIYYMTSPASPTQQFIRLAAPTFPEGVFNNRTEMIWNAPANINTQEYTPTYEVYESKTMQTGGVQNSTRYNIEHYTGGNYYTFRIKAVGNDTKYLDSEFSTEITVYKLETPVMTVENGQYVWQNVANASTYVLEIDGVRVNNEFHVSGTANAYTPSYTEVGNHTVRLLAIGDGKNTVDSAACVYTQVVKEHLSPEFEYNYSAESYVNGGYITATITTPTATASKYRYDLAGQSIDSSELTVTKPIESTGTYTLRIKALGGDFDAENTYYVDSPYAGGNSGYIITLLGAPSLSSFKINSDGVISWATISDALGYDYQIAFNDGEYEELQHRGVSALNPIADYNSYHTIKIKVRSSGNGSTVIASEWVEFIWDNPHL